MRILNWHRLFGIALADIFSGTPWFVELEKEVALQSQRLDVAIIRRSPEAAVVAGAVPGLLLPDGLEPLRAYNLLTFKSHHEPLSGFALHELTGHYVNYRKSTRQGKRMLPESAFGLYAVSVRFPIRLASQVSLVPAGRPGVFDIPWGTSHIRLILVEEMDRHERNALWHLFSRNHERARFGVRSYNFRRKGGRTLFYELYLKYKMERLDMAYTMEDFLRDSTEHMVQFLSTQDGRDFIFRLRPEHRQSFMMQFPEEDRRRFLQLMSPEERERLFKQLTAEDRQAFLQQLSPDERLRGLSPEDRLQGLDDEELKRLRDYLDRLN